MKSAPRHNSRGAGRWADRQALRPVYQSQIPSNSSPAPKAPSCPIVPGIPCEFQVTTAPIKSETPPIMAVNQYGTVAPELPMTYSRIAMMR